LNAMRPIFKSIEKVLLVPTEEKMAVAAVAIKTLL
jgi:hypothetical protein